MLTTEVRLPLFWRALLGSVLLIKDGRGASKLARVAERIGTAPQNKLLCVTLLLKVMHDHRCN